MGAFATSLAAIVNGQRQGTQASNFVAQQYQQQQLQDQLKSALLMGQLQDWQRGNAALAQTSPEEQQFLNLGGTVADWQKRQDLEGRAGARADDLGQLALKPGLTPQQQIGIYRLMVRLRQDPTSLNDVNNELKEMGVVTREGPDPGVAAASGNLFSSLGALPSGAPVSSAMPIAAAAAAAGVPSGIISEGMKLKGYGVETPAAKLAETPIYGMKGINIVTPSGDPWPNPADTLGDAVKKGGIPLSDKGKDALALNSAANDDLSNLLETGKTVLPGGTGGISNAIAPFRIAGEAALGSPDASAYNAAKIALITHLRAVANAARVNQQELAQVNGALANAHSYPALVAAVNQAQNLLAKSRKYIVKAGVIDPSTYGSSPTSDTAPAGYTPYSGPVLK